MIILLLALFFKCIFAFSNITVELTSSIYKDNKIYVYEPIDIELKWPALTIYHLNNGPISQFKKEKVNLTNINPTYVPQFIHFPSDLPNNKSDHLWMMGGLPEMDITSSKIYSAYWSSEIVNDKELKFNNSFIKIPEFENFPKGGYSQIVVNSNDSLVLYIIGGFVYSPEIDDQLLTNHFFKYEFKSETWSDLSESTKSILPPLAYHRTVLVDNMLVVAGGITNESPLPKNFTHSIPSTDNNINHNTMDKIFKYDLSTHKWSPINPKVNKDFSTYLIGLTVGPSLDVYNGKIITYAALYNRITRTFDPQLGILDPKTWEWEWRVVKTEDGTDNSLGLMYHQTVIINDQLIMIHGGGNQGDLRKLWAIDLKTDTLTSSLNITGNYTDKASDALEPVIPVPDNSTTQKSGLPQWAIIIIVVGIIAVIFIIASIWLYSRYKNKSNINGKQGQKMQDVWAAPRQQSEEFSNTGKILAFGNTNTTNVKANTISNDENIDRYKFFQHEVDLKDLNKPEAPAKVHHN